MQLSSDAVAILEHLQAGRRRLEMAGQLEREFYRRGWPRLKYGNEAWKDEPRDSDGEWTAGAGGQRAFSDRRRKKSDKRCASDGSLDESAAADDGAQRRQVLAAVKSDFSYWLSGFAQHFPERAAHYEATAHEVLGTMNTKALALFRTTVHRAEFYTNLRTLNDSLREHAPTDRNELLCGMVDGDTHVVHLDGGSDTGERIAPTAKDIYAHEFYHGIDLAAGYSGSEDWQMAYRKEISAGQLSRRANLNASEGFAEFGRMIVTDPRQAERDFPKCWVFCKEQGII